MFFFKKSNRGNNTIYKIVKEINQCLDNGCVIAGLSLALILPDICGKAIYPDTRPSKRYIKWFDDYVLSFEQRDKQIKEEIPWLNSEIIFSLRNSILHEGNPNIDKTKLDVVYFELIYQQQKQATISNICFSQIINEDKGSKKEIKKISINVRDLCSKICYAALKCYVKDRNKFNFFNYDLYDINFMTRQIFKIEGRNIIK